MAKPILSNLPKEDRKFIKTIGIIMLVILIASAVFMHYYFLNKMEKMEAEKADDTVKTDSLAHEELPALPVVPNIDNFITPGNIDSVPDFDIDAHLQAIDSSKPKSNYASVNELSERMADFLLKKYRLSAKWGHILLEAGYPGEAAYVLQKGVPADSASVQVLIDLAFALFQSESVENALGELEKALTKFPNNVDLLTAKAAITGEHPDTTKRAGAESIFRAALKINPKSPEANYQYGRYIMQNGDFKRSRVYLENAVVSLPFNSRYIARLGMVEFYLKQDSKAEQLYKRALDINPDDYNTWFNLGELYLSQANESTHIPIVKQKTYAAFKAYLKAIENYPSHIQAHFRVGTILSGNGEFKEAINHLLIAFKQMPNDISSMQQLASAYAQLGDTTTSVNLLRKALQIDPFNKITVTQYNAITKQEN